MINIDKKLNDNQIIKGIILQQIENSDLNGQIIGQILGISRMHLHRRIKIATGLSISECILGVRIDEAKKFLLNSNEHVATIAYNLGFKDASYFTRVFKKKVNCTPSQFRLMWKDTISTTNSSNSKEKEEEETTVKGERQRG